MRVRATERESRQLYDFASVGEAYRAVKIADSALHRGPELKRDLFQSYRADDRRRIAANRRGAVNLAHAGDVMSGSRSYHRTEIGEVEAVRIDLHAQGLRAAARESARRQIEIGEFQVDARDVEPLSPCAAGIDRHRGLRRLVEYRGVRNSCCGEIGTKRNRELSERTARSSADRYGIGNRKARRNVLTDVSQRPDAIEHDRVELQIQIDRDSGSLQHASFENRPELSRHRDVLRVARKSKFRL